MYADSSYRALSKPQPNGQSLWVYLLTGPHTTSIPGLSTAGEAAMAEALGWPLEGFRYAFGEVLAKGMAKADWEARVVWVPKAVKYNPPESINVVKSWAKAWEEIPDCALKVTAFTTLKAFMEGMPDAFRYAFMHAIPYPGAGAGAGAVSVLSAGADVTDPSTTDSAIRQHAPPAGVTGDADKAGRGKARKPKPKAPEKPEHAELREYFREQWKARNDGTDYAWKHPRDDAHAKWILDQCGRDVAQAKAMVRSFLADDDPWLAERGHEISLLVSRFNRYRSKRQPQQDDNGFVRVERTDAEWDEFLRQPGATQ
jgi:hypothetical protein